MLLEDLRARPGSGVGILLTIELGDLFVGHLGNAAFSEAIRAILRLSLVVCVVRFHNALKKIYYSWSLIIEIS